MSLLKTTCNDAQLIADSQTTMQTRSKPVEKTGDINQSLYTWPSPHSRKGTAGGGTFSSPSNSSGAIHASAAVKSPIVKSPDFCAVGYNRDTVFEILATAGLEEAITSALPEDAETRMAVKIMTLFPQADYWPKCKAEMLSNALICSAIQSAKVLLVMCLALEELDLMTPEDRFITVGGTPVAKRVNPSDLRRDVTRAIGCPNLASGPKELNYIPPRDLFLDFICELCAWLDMLDPLMSRVVRDIADTHGPNLAQITDWEHSLGTDGRALLYHILVTKTNMSEGLRKFFIREIGEAKNGVAILQVLCAATIQYTLHTLDGKLHAMINAAPSSSPHNVQKSLQEHEQRLRELRQMNATGDEVTINLLEIGVLKRICAQISPALAIITKQELEEGMDLCLSSLKEKLMIWAEKNL